MSAPRLVAVLFADLVSSTETVASLGPEAGEAWRQRFLGAMREALAAARGREVQHTGDGHLITFDGPTQAIRCAEALRADVEALGIEIRIGIHTGECELVGDKIAGIAVVTGSRISSLAASGEVLVSSTVKDLVAGSGFGFESRGEHELKGVQGEWQLYAVTDLGAG